MHSDEFLGLEGEVLIKLVGRWVQGERGWEKYGRGIQDLVRHC